MSLHSFLIGTLLLLSMPSLANAAVQDIEAGQLVAAYMVEIDGNFYDVEFVDGTCADLFDGCDSSDDFTFTNGADALTASYALLDQVFVNTSYGPFDEASELTHGCPEGTECHAFTV